MAPSPIGTPSGFPRTAARLRALGHGDGGLTATGLLRICPEEVPERARVIGNDGFEQEARPTGNAEQLGDRPGASAGDGEDGLAAGGLHRRDHL